MSRFGLLVATVLVLVGIALATMVRVTGPGWRAAAPPSAPASGATVAAAQVLAVPVQGVATAALVDSWADPRDGGARGHHAIDIPVAAGTPVLATADGRIEKLFTSALGGLTIYQRSRDGGTIYYYAHLDRYAPTLAEGQSVRRGQVIGAAGATGDAAPGAPHLHFEIHRMAPGERWWQGTGVDPYPLLRAGRG